MFRRLRDMMSTPPAPADIWIRPAFAKTAGPGPHQGQGPRRFLDECTDRGRDRRCSYNNPSPSYLPGSRRSRNSWKKSIHASAVITQIIKKKQSIDVLVVARIKIAPFRKSSTPFPSSRTCWGKVADCSWEYINGQALFAKNTIFGFKFEVFLGNLHQCNLVIWNLLALPNKMAKTACQNLAWFAFYGTLKSANLEPESIKTL